MEIQCASAILCAAGISWSEGPPWVATIPCIVATPWVVEIPSIAWDFMDCSDPGAEAAHWVAAAQWSAAILMAKAMPSAPVTFVRRRRRSNQR